MTVAFESRVNFGLPLYGGVQTAVVIFNGRPFEKFNGGNDLFLCHRHHYPYPIPPFDQFWKNFRVILRPSSTHQP